MFKFKLIKIPVFSSSSELTQLERSGPRFSNMARFLRVTLILLGVLYPVFIYFGLQFLSLNWLGLCLVSFLIARFLLFPYTSKIIPNVVSLGLVFCGIAPVAISVISGNETIILYYPILISFVWLGVFLWGLIRPPNIIEQIVTISHESLSKEGKQYTEKVAVAWIVFFIINIAITFLCIKTDNYELWTLYCGFISYLLMGCIFVGERLYRKWYLPNYV